MTAYSASAISQLLPKADARAVVYVEVDTVRDGKVVGRGWHVLRRWPGAMNFGPAQGEATGEAVTCSIDPLEDQDVNVRYHQALNRDADAPAKIEFPDGSVIVAERRHGRRESRTFRVDGPMRTIITHDGAVATLALIDKHAAAGRHAEAAEWTRGLVATLRARAGLLERDEKALATALARCK